jgi:UDP-N-acetylmuramyl tripeptide synthase
MRALAQRGCARALRALARLGPRGRPGRPEALADLLSPVRTLVVVTGTNGKSTTAHLLEQILARAGRLPVRNRDGANLAHGVAVTLSGAWFLARRPVILEVDEGSLSEVVPPARPTVLVLTNVFRDQLDRYGEVDAIASRIRDAVAAAPRGCVLAANADDPTVADIAARSGRRVVFFGLELPGRGTPGAAADSVLCPRCGESLSFSRVFLSHLGHYRCPGCGFGRPTPALAASGPAPAGVRAVAFTLDATPVTAPLVGIHGIYNAIAAAAAARVLGVRDAVTAAALRTAAPMPGRSEWIEHEGRRVFLGLVKNPAGFEALAGALASGARPRDVLLLLNDRRADGGDTSWIWDADVGAFAGDRIRVGGSRAEALALRLKYAGLPLCAPPVREHGPAFEAAVGGTPPGECLYVLLNYSAMLDLFGALRKGLVPA